MGINGLLPALKPIAKQTHVCKYNGQKAAVDGYSWLHKGAYCCARELCEGNWTDKFVTYFLNRIKLLRSNGVEPVVVFDGGRLPIKGQEEQSRHRSRKEAREKAAAHLAAGNIAAAVESYQRCVDITPAMAKQVIEELKAQDVAFIVAPYEADAQMAYLAKRGDVQLVITEDSDLLAYGCPRVLYKLDKTGSGEEVSTADLPHCSSLPLSSFTSDQFLQLCIMAGCDFLTQLPSIGLKKAHGLLRKYRSFTKVLKMMRFNGTKVPLDYETQFQKAIWAFRHCRVYCPTTKALQYLSPLPAGGLGAADVDVPAALRQLEQEQQHQILDFLGPDLPQDVAQGIAEGRLDPNSHKPFNLSAIYAGCRHPPPHIAAELKTATAAVPHLLGLNGQAGDFSGCQAASAGDRSRAAAASARPLSGGRRSGSGRVGLSKKNASRGQRKLNWAAAKGAASGSGPQATAAAGSTSEKKKATLGIAKFFSAPGAQQQQQDVLTAADDAHAAGAARPADHTEQQNSMQNSIRQALHALRQQQQQRHQQAEADKQQLLSQLREHEQQATAVAIVNVDDAAREAAPAAANELSDVSEPPEAAPMPPAKRQRTSAEHNNWLTPAVDVASSKVDEAAATASPAMHVSSPGEMLPIRQLGHLEHGSSIDSLGSQELSRQLLAGQEPALRLNGSIPMTIESEAVGLGASGQGAFLHSLGNADTAADLRQAAASVSDGFGPAIAASYGASESIGHQLPMDGSSLNAGCADLGGLGSSLSGSLGLSSSSVPASLDRSLGLPASSGGRGAAVSALAALLRAPQQQQPLVPPFLEASSGNGLGSISDADLSQQQRTLLGSCPSSSMYGLGISSSEDLLGGGADSSCGLGSGLQRANHQLAGPAWLTGRSAATGQGICSYMTPHFITQQQESDGEDEVVSPPRPHDLALGGSSSQPWKRLQQSLRGVGGGLNSSLHKMSDPVQPGSTLQGLKKQLGGRGRRSRLSNAISSSTEGLSSELGLELATSDDLADAHDAAGAAADDSSSPKMPNLGLGLLQQQSRQRHIDCLGRRDLRHEAKQRKQSAAYCTQQQPDDVLIVPDSEDDLDTAPGAAAPAPAAGPGSGTTGGSSTGGSSLDASNDENAIPDIHSIAHVRKYAKLASKVVDKVQLQQQVQQQQTQQTSRSPLQASAAANVAAQPVAASQPLGHSSMQLAKKLRSSNQPGKRLRGKQQPGRHKTLSADLAALRHDPSMFVPVQPLADDITEELFFCAEGVIDGDNSCSLVGIRAPKEAGGAPQNLGLGLHAPRTGLGRPAGRARNMFGSHIGGSRGNAARPFKAPTLQRAADGGELDASTGDDSFGAFGGFACV